LAKVGCAGILVADTFCGPMKRLPQAGELLALDQMPSKAGGCAANVAIDLAKQGITVDVCGCVGGDASAEVLLKSLSSAGVDCGQIRRLGTHPTSKTVILLVEGEDRRFIHVFGANAAFDIGQIRRDWIDSLKVFYFGGLLCLPGVSMEQLAELLGYCRGRGVTTVVDVVVPQNQQAVGQLELILPYTDYFMPNDDEARRLTGVAEPEGQIEAFLRYGAKTVVITCGAGGAIAATGRHRWQADAYGVETVDPSGSGDAFAAGFVAGILRQWDMTDTLRYAAALGASAVTAVGTTDGVFTTQQAQAFIEQHPLMVNHSERQ